MSFFSIKNVNLEGPETHRTWVNDLEYITVGSQSLLYTVSGPSGGLLAFDPETLTLVAAYDFENGSELARPVEMHRGELDGVDVLYAYGRYGSGLTVYDILSDGQLGNARSVVGGAETVLSAVAVVPDDQGDILVSANNASGGFSSWRVGHGSELDLLDEVAFGNANPANNIYHIETVALAGKTYVLAVSGASGSVLSFGVEPDGTFEVMDEVGQEAGLSLSYPALVAVAQTTDTTWLIVGGQGSSSLAAMRINAAGELEVTDEVYDDLNTRFQDVMVLDAVVLNDRVYLIAGGGDDGLSLLTLLPDGTFLHLESFADTLDVPLTDPTALTVTVSDNAIQVFVVGRDDDEKQLSGVTHFELQIDGAGSVGTVRRAEAGQDTVYGTDGADQLIGGDAALEVLFGGVGADVLMDSPGLDVFYGGEGADVFVIGEPDGQRDEIRDFELGMDRIDLNDAGFVYSVDGLTVRSRHNGAILEIGDEQLRVYSHDETRLEASDFRDLDLFDLSHSFRIAAAVGDQEILGSAANDFLTGDTGNDTLVGAGGRDELFGGAGSDLLLAESQDVPFDTTAAQVYRLYLATLDRTPDQAGHFYWTENLLSQQSTLVDVASGFTNSLEFRNTYGTTDDEAFVELLYQNVLDRPSDEAGLMFWVNALETGAMSRQEVVIGFSESAEFRTETTTEALAFSRSGHQAQWLDDVFRLYQATLDRAPDEGGILYWTQELADGQTFANVVNGFVGSAEFQMRYGDLSDEDFVTLLYRNVLNRDPDQGGLEAWTGALANDAPRSFVVEGFSQSLEFVNATQGDLVAWARSIGSDDVLYAGGGTDDVLMGGVLSDTFVFDAAEGSNSAVVDFEAWDRLDLSAFGHSSPAEALSYFSADGSDVRYVNEGVTIVLLNTNLGALDEDSFIF